MAEIASAIFGFISEKLASKALSEFALQTDVNENLRKLEETRSAIQSVLEDAEAGQVKEKDPLYRSRKRKLKDLAYDVDDLIDDIAFKAPKLEKSDVKEKVRSLLSFPKDFAFKRENARRAKEINERFNELVEVSSKFQLKGGEVGNVEVESSTVREEKGSFVNESEVYGREEDKERIIEFLMNASTGGEIDVIGIVGLGGLGKTTLAGLVYNDEWVCRNFKKRMWVSVPKEFEIKEVVRLIIESAKGEKYPPINMNEMQMTLKNELEKKRFLLVLDDVWSGRNLKWEDLSSLLSVGAKGSKVIVTTRNERIASMMGTVPPYQLSTLSSDDCLLLLERRAFKNGVERNPNLVLIGKEIAKKCGGVPLAAKALGGLLSFKKTESEWLAIKNSELWELSAVENYEFLPALKLSYDDLSSSLKHCFSYCSIFPKNYEIEVRELVKLWGAEGFLKSSVGHIHWEEIGLQYVDELLTRSLFQKFGKGSLELHDLIYDLVQSVAGDESSVVDLSTGRFLSQNSRFASFTCKEQQLSVALQSLHEATKLRTFYLKYSAKDTEQGLQKALLDISSNFKLLRALHLSWYQLKALPDSFKKLRHLRYLNLSYTSLEIYPLCINTLHNLQTLSFHGSNIKSIPESIGNLHNLYSLDFGNCRYLSSLPSSFGRLHCLRELDLSGSSLEIFPLCISTLHNLQTLNLHSSKIKSIPESIGNLHNLCSLYFSWCNGLSSLPSSIGQLYCLRELDLSYSKIKSLPESICALSNLHTLQLRRCYFIHELPPNLSDMKSLVHLGIHGCNELTCMPENLGKLNQLRTLPFFIPGGRTNCSLTEIGGLNLEGELHLRNLQNVKRVEEAKCAQLSNKYGIQSLKLSWDLNFYIDSAEYDSDDDDEELEDIKIVAEHVFQSLQPSRSLRKLEIEGYPGRTLPSWMMELSLSNLLELTLNNCLFEKISLLGRQPRLKVLRLISLPSITHLGSDFYGGGNAFPSLKELELRHMIHLEKWCSLGGEQLLPCLGTLTLHNCPKLKALPSEFSSVKTLKMNADDKLLLSSLQNNGFPNLKDIVMYNCYGENSVPEELRERVDSLKIHRH